MPSSCRRRCRDVRRRCSSVMSACPSAGLISSSTFTDINSPPPISSRSLTNSRSIKAPAPAPHCRGARRPTGSWHKSVGRRGGDSPRRTGHTCISPHQTSHGVARKGGLGRVVHRQRGEEGRSSLFQTLASCRVALGLHPRRVHDQRGAFPAPHKQSNGEVHSATGARRPAKVLCRLDEASSADRNHRV